MGTKIHSYFIWCRCGLSHDVRDVGTLMWMRSELNGDNFGCITFKGSLVGGPPWFRDIEMSPLGFGNYLLIPFSLHAFILLTFSMYWFSYFSCSLWFNAMLIRLKIYMISIWDTLMFIWIHILCSHYNLTIVYIIALRYVHLHNDHIGFCLCFVLHDLITCLDVIFIKTCVYTCTTIEPQIDYYMFVLDCSFVLIRCTSIA